MSGATHSPSNNVQSSLHGTGVFLPHPKTHSTRIERKMISSYNRTRRLGEASSTGSSGADSSTKQPNSQPVDSALTSSRLHSISEAVVHNSTEQALPNLTPVSSPTCALVEAFGGAEEDQGNSAGINSAQGHSSNTNMRLSIAQLSGSSWRDPLAAPEVGGWPDPLAAPEVGSWPITRPRSIGSGSRQPLPQPPPPPPLQQPPPPPQQDAAAGFTASRVPSQISSSSGSKGMHGVEVPSTTAYFASSAAQAPETLPVPRPRTRSQVINSASCQHQLLFSDQERLLQHHHHQQQQRPDLLAGSSGSACSPLQLQGTQQGLLHGMISRHNSSALGPQAAAQAHLQGSGEQAMMAAIDEQVVQLLQLRQQAIMQSAQAAKATAINVSTAGPACDLTSPQLPGHTSAASLIPTSAAVQNRQGSTGSTSLLQLPQLNVQTLVAEAVTASDQNLELLQLVPELTRQMSGLGLQQHLSGSSLVEACAPLDSLQVDLLGSFGGGSASMLHSASASMAAAMPITGVDQQPQQQCIMRGLNGSGSLAGGSMGQGSTLQYQQQQHLNNNSGSLFGDQTPYGSLGGLSPAQSGGLWNAIDVSSLPALGQLQSGNQPGDLNATSTDMAVRNAAVAAKVRQLEMVQSMQQQLQEELLQLLQ